MYIRMLKGPNAKPLKNEVNMGTTINLSRTAEILSAEGNKDPIVIVPYALSI